MAADLTAAITGLSVTQRGRGTHKDTQQGEQEQDSTIKNIWDS